MLDRECPYCKEKVKSNAVICKHCKSKLPPLQPKPPIPSTPPKKWYQTWWGFLIIMYALSLISRPFLNQSPSTPTQIAEKNITYKQASDFSGAEKRKSFAITIMGIYQHRGSDLIMNATGEDNKTLMCWSKEFNQSFVSILMKEGFDVGPKSVGFTKIEFYRDPATHIVSYDLTE